jgi:signal recognition particle GTPase
MITEAKRAEYQQFSEWSRQLNHSVISSQNESEAVAIVFHEK